jgi:hypothetical protein
MFLAMLIVSTGTVTSCKDDDDDKASDELRTDPLARNTIIKNWLPLSVQPILIYVKKLPWQDSFLRFSLFASHFSEYLCTRN